MKKSRFGKLIRKVNWYPPYLAVARVNKEIYVRVKEKRAATQVRKRRRQIRAAAQ